MAYSFDSKFEAKSLKELERRLSRVASEAVVEVRASNRKHANRLADLIRNETPRGGEAVQHRHPRSKASGASRSRGTGGMKRSVRSRATADAAAVLGGMKRTPYFIVNEFGGGVKWTNKNGKSHGIPVRERAPSMVALGLYDDHGGQRGSAGWFFFPTVRKYLPDIQEELVRDAERVIRSELTQSPIGP